MDTNTDIMMLSPWVHHPLATTQHLSFEATGTIPRRSYHHLVQDTLRQHHLLQHPLQGDTGIVIPRGLVLKPIAIRLSDVYSSVPLTVSLLESQVTPEYISRFRGLEERSGEHKYSQFCLGGEPFRGLSPTALRKAEMNKRVLFPFPQRQSSTDRMNDIFRELLNMRLGFLHHKEACVGAEKGFARGTRSDVFRTSSECAPRHGDDGVVFNSSRPIGSDVTPDSISSSRKHVYLNQPITDENNGIAPFFNAPIQPSHSLETLNTDETKKSNKRFLTPVSSVNKFMKKRKPLVEGLLLDNQNKKACEHLESSVLSFQIPTSEKNRESVVRGNVLPVSAEQLAMTGDEILDSKNGFKGDNFSARKMAKPDKCNIRGKIQSAKGAKPLRLISSVKSLSADRKSFQCPQCRYLTDRKNNLKRHVITMHQVSAKMLECCGVAFQSKASLRDHNAVFHRGGYRCQICSRNFCRKALLRRHLTVHSGQKDFFCDLCGYATSHKSNLERHQKVHSKREVSNPVDKRDFYQRRKASKSCLRSPGVYSDASSIPRRPDAQKMSPDVVEDVSSNDESWTRRDTHLKRSRGTITTPVYPRKDRVVEGDVVQSNLVDTTTGMQL